MGTQFIWKTPRPYEKRDGQYIHAFMPNVCINFATGEMWLSHGKIHFEADGAGYLAGKHINWTKDGEIIIGTATEEGLEVVLWRPNGSMIGPLNGYVISNDSRVSAAETLLILQSVNLEVWVMMGGFLLMNAKL